MDAFVVTVWIAGTLAKIVGALGLWKRGLARRLWALTALLAFASAQNAIGMVALAVDSRGPIYRRVYGVSVWASTAFDGLAIVNSFWLVAENYPRIRKPGIALLVGLAGLGAALLWVSGNITPPAGWYGPWHYAILVQRTMYAVMIFMLCGARALLPRISGIPISRLAKRTADVLTLHATLILAAAVIETIGGQEVRYRSISSWLIAINGLVFGLLCVWLSSQSEILEDGAVGLSEKRKQQRLRAAAAFHATYWGLRKKAREAADEPRASARSSSEAN